MIKHLGKLIWRQSRDISVLNYPRHTVFEIFTNQGTIKVIQDKESKRYEVIDPTPMPKYQAPPMKLSVDVE